MSKKTKAFGKGFTCVMAAGAVVALTCAPAFGSTASNIESSSEPVNISDSLLTTMGARAGSAGPDFLGISNMNYDFQASHGANAGDPYPYYIAAGTNPVSGKTQSGTGYKADMAKADAFNRLAIWGSGVNQSANPYYQNLLVNVLNGTDTDGGLPDGYTMATTYHSNSNSWGDVAVSGVSVVSSTYKPDFIFGANKKTNWQDGDFATGTLAKAAADEISGYNPTYANNDSTNIWTQIYTLQQLASQANAVTSNGSKQTRYNDSDANVSALNYEKVIKGQMLYCASQLDANNWQGKKTVAYLYAIDEEAGKAYFFVPETSGLTNGDDTGSGVTSDDPNSSKQDIYASNNSTINMGYMATLPFITDTFGTSQDISDKKCTKRDGGIQMIVEDIYKKNPVVEVSSDNKDALKDVDVIIYNSTTQTGSMKGTKNGLCIDEDINNSKALNDENVMSWAKAYGFNGTTLAGDDYGCSNKQSTADNVGATTGSSPMLYCQRNYTIDKNARAAWAFSKVYPEFYGGNDDATYAAWLENVYHIKSSQVNNVLAAYTHQSVDNVDTYGYDNADYVNDLADLGYKWYTAQASSSVYKTDWAYYNGSSRASYYSGTTTAEEPTNVISIFQPSTLWTASMPVSKKANTIKVGKTKVKVKKGKKATVKVKKAKGTVTVSTSKKKVAKATYSKKTGKVTIKGVKKGTAKITVKAAGNANYKAGKKVIKVTVK